MFYLRKLHFLSFTFPRTVVSCRVFQKVDPSSTWEPLAIGIIRICEQFLRVKAREARPYLVANQDVVESIASFTNKHPSSRVVIDAITAAADQVRSSGYDM